MEGESKGAAMGSERWREIGAELSNREGACGIDCFDLACMQIASLEREATAEVEALRARLHHDCEGCPGCSSNDCPDALDVAERERDEAHQAFADQVLAMRVAASRLEEVAAERDGLRHRLNVVDLPGGAPGEGGWTSTSRNRQRIGAIIDRLDICTPDDDLLDAVAGMIDQADRERDEALAVVASLSMAIPDGGFQGALDRIRAEAGAAALRDVATHPDMTCPDCEAKIQRKADDIEGGRDASR